MKRCLGAPAHFEADCGAPGPHGEHPISGPGFVCEAYGPELPDHCFFELTSVCGSAAQCAERLVDERVRVFGRLQEMKASGDPIGIYLAGEFTAPEELLGGPATRREQAPLFACAQCGQALADDNCPAICPCGKQ